MYGGQGRMEGWIPVFDALQYRFYSEISQGAQIDNQTDQLMMNHEGLKCSSGILENEYYLRHHFTYIMENPDVYI